MNNDPMDASGAGSNASAGGNRLPRGQKPVTKAELEAVRRQLQQEIAAGDARISQEVAGMIADLRTAVTSDIAAQFNPLTTQMTTISTIVSNLDEFVRKEKEADAEEARLRHEEALKEQLLRDINAKQDAEQRAKDAEQKARAEDERKRVAARRLKWRTVISILVPATAGLFGGGTLEFLQQAQTGIRANSALLLVIVPYGLMAVLIITILILRL